MIPQVACPCAAVPLRRQKRRPNPVQAHSRRKHVVIKICIVVNVASLKIGDDRQIEIFEFAVGNGIGINFIGGVYAIVKLLP